MSTHDKLQALLNQFQADAAAQVQATFQFTIDTEHYYLAIADQQCRLHSGPAEDADVTFILDAATLNELLQGPGNGMQLFMAGRLQIQGDMALATQLPSLFAL